MAAGSHCSAPGVGYGRGDQFLDASREVVSSDWGSYHMSGLEHPEESEVLVGLVEGGRGSVDQQHSLLGPPEPRHARPAQSVQPLEGACKRSRLSPVCF